LLIQQTGKARSASLVPKAIASLNLVDWAKGIFLNNPEQLWLRWWDLDGNLLLTGHEQAEQERQEKEQALQQLEQEQQKRQ